MNNPSPEDLLATIIEDIIKTNLITQCWDCYKFHKLDMDRYDLIEYVVLFYKLGQFNENKTSSNIASKISYRVNFKENGGVYVGDPVTNRACGSIQLGYTSLHLLYENPIITTCDLGLFTCDPYLINSRYLDKALIKLFPSLILDLIDKGQLILLPPIFSNGTWIHGNESIFSLNTLESEASYVTYQFLKQNYKKIKEIGGARKYKPGWVWHKLMDLDCEIQKLWSKIGYYLPIINLVNGFVSDYKKEIFPALYYDEIEKLLERR